MTNKKPNEVTLFISHKHHEVDVLIANTFRSHLKKWLSGPNCICAMKVVQSSQTGTPFFPYGQDVKDSVRAAVEKSDLVLVIYTNPDKDWSWVMFEAGLSQNPKTIHENKSLIVFSAHDEAPNPLRNLKDIKKNKASIEDFVKSFHSDEQPLIKSIPCFFRKSPSNKTITDRALAFWNDLNAINTSCSILETSCPSFSLEIPHIFGFEPGSFRRGQRPRVGEVQKCVKKCTVNVLSDSDAQIFDLAHAGSQLTMSALVGAWRKASTYGKLRWDDKLFADLVRSVFGNSFNQKMIPFPDANSDQNWFLPRVNCLRSTAVAGGFKYSYDVTLLPLDMVIAKEIVKHYAGAEVIEAKINKDVRKSEGDPLIEKWVSSEKLTLWDRAYKILLKEPGKHVPQHYRLLSYKYWGSPHSESKLGSGIDKAIAISNKGLSVAYARDELSEVRAIKNCLAYYYADNNQDDKATIAADYAGSAVKNVDKDTEEYAEALDTLGFVQISFGHSSEEVMDGVLKCCEARNLGVSSKLLIKHAKKARLRVLELSKFSK